MLFLDDSGKPDLSHPSLGLVIGGFSVPSTQVPTLSRRVAGAKPESTDGVWFGGGWIDVESASDLGQ